MRGKTVLLGLILGLWSVVAAAQAPVRTPNEADIYCSGMVTSEHIPYGTYLITGEESLTQVTYSEGDYVYINKGSKQGVSVGDEFLVMRPVKDPNKMNWFVWQSYLLHEMGTVWMDIGRLRVVALRPKIAIAQIVYSCDFMQRGDYVRPFEERPAPPLKSEAKFDRFAPPTGGKIGMVVVAKDFRESVGQGDIAYVNLGRKQGVKVGDYFRMFRRQGGERETTYQTKGMATDVYGFGHSPGSYSPHDLPRENLGEGVVLRSTRNTSTVLITFSLKGIYMGNYVELEPEAETAAAIAAAAAPAPPAAPGAAPVQPAPVQPPTLRCSADRTSVLPGERVRIRGIGSDPSGYPLTYTWRPSGGQVIGSGSYVQLDTSGLPPGPYTVTGRVDNGRGGVADCSVSLDVQASAAAPQASKSSELSFRSSSARVDNVSKRVLDDVGLRLKTDLKARVVLVGYADPKEPAPEELARKRAENAKNYLVSQGIAEFRIEVRAQVGQEGAQNRRVDVIWVPEGISY